MSFSHVPRASRPTSSSQTPNIASYMSARPDVSRLPQGAREEHRGSSIRDDFDGREHGRQNRILDHRHATFFVPSYLRNSRHVQRLQRVHEQYVEGQRLLGRSHSSRLSMSSSSTNLHQSSVPMHRGVARDVIERIPKDPDALDPFPTAWSDEDKAAGLEILGDGTEVRFSGLSFKNQDEASAIRANYPVPREIGIYYYEVTILSKGKDNLIGIGFSNKDSVLTRFPGWEPGTYAWHGDDGDIFSGSSNSGKQYGPHFASHDVIGCGLDLRHGIIFYTKNGVPLGPAFKDFKLAELYPSVGMKKANEHIRVNFGRTPFVYDIDAHVAKERDEVLKSIDAADTSKLHPPDDESTLIQNLIGQYLAHEGFIEASRAFQHDINEQRRLAPSTKGRPLLQDTSEDDVHSVNRQRIRRAVLDGDIDRALKHTQSCYPQLLNQDRNKNIYFRLRCRKFIEMMARYSDLTAAISMSRESLPRNGHNEHDVQMELDDQLNRETAEALMQDTDMDAETPIFSLKQNELLEAAIVYGQGLKTEFDKDPTPSVQNELNEMFALMAYEDPKASPIGHILDKSGRSSIAEELNGAILVSLGKPSSAALEKLCSQTENLLDEVAHKAGGPAAFVNVRQDFLLS